MALCNFIRGLTLPLAVLLCVTLAHAQSVQPLKPADRSSPRAALQTFLDSGDAFGDLARDYLASPSRAKYDRLRLLADKRSHGLDLSGSG